VPTAASSTLQSEADLQACRLTYPLFAKPVAEGTGKGIDQRSIVRSPAELQTVCRRLWKQFQQPVLVEPYLPGREFTVGLLGTGERASVLGTLEIVMRPAAQPDVYSYANKENSEELVEYRLAQATKDDEVRQAERIALDAWRALGCRDAGRVDVRSDEHRQPQFIEVNPLAGLHPQHSDLPMLCTALGMPYDELIERIVASASERIAAAQVEGARLARLDAGHVGRS
jgi:D-alanine-D-alanine ligase